MRHYFETLWAWRDDLLRFGTEMAGLFIVASHTKYFTLMLSVFFLKMDFVLCLFFYNKKSTISYQKINTESNSTMMKIIIIIIIIVKLKII